jgi:choline dehydrogenase-like flavoprotein
MRKQKYWPSNVDLQLKIWIEQLPRWQNRICLSDQTDDLQVPRLKLEWAATDAEERASRVMVEKICRYWQRHLIRICDLKWNPLISETGGCLMDAAADLAHPAGSTRMGETPSSSVVDPDMMVHRIPNLSVASSSVFPTSGSANPTLTIMQLAMRAADALARRLAP